MNNKPFRRGNPFLQDIQNAQHKMVIEMSLLDLYIGDKDGIRDILHYLASLSIIY